MRYKKAATAAGTPIMRYSMAKLFKFALQYQTTKLCSGEYIHVFTSANATL